MRVLEGEGLALLFIREVSRHGEKTGSLGIWNGMAPLVGHCLESGKSSAHNMIFNV